MIHLRIRRFDPDVDKEPHFTSYEVPLSKDATVLECLYHVLENSDGTLAFRSSCRAAVCGSCAMKINGHYALACRTLVKSLGSDTVVVEPLAHLPVIKDLVVDMTRFYEKYEYIQPFLVPKEVPAGKESYQSPEDRKKIDGLVECILCGACYASCTMVSWDPRFPGPFALLAADAKLKDTRDAEGRERLQMLIDESGIWRCHTELGCTDVCPKNLSPTEAITHLKRESVLYNFSSPLRQTLERQKPAIAPVAPPPDALTARRTVLKTIFLGGVGALAAAFVSLFSVPLLSKPRRDWVPGWIKIGPVPDLDVNRPTEIVYHSQRWEAGVLASYPRRVYLVRTDSGQLNAIDPICTHLGCICYWDDAIRLFLCPCHGGGFDVNGTVTLGPPPAPLARLDVKVEDGTLYLRKDA
jgi:succinate dehydrogenase / fumarate reductase, iron-sulfur subunit